MNVESNEISESVDELLQAGIAAAQARQREEARELLGRVVEREPGYSEAWLWLSRTTETLDGRQMCLEKVLELEPDNEEARQGLDQLQRERLYDWLNEGIAAVRVGERKRARELFMRVVEQDERHAEAWMWLSGVVDRPEEREICLENVLTIEPDNETARSVLALMREEMARQPAPQGGPEAGFPTADQAAPSMAAAVPLSMLVEEKGTESSVPSLSPPADLTKPASELPEQAPRPGRLDLPFPPSADPLDHAYNCPYCAAPTEPKDRRCRACGGRLWIRVAAKETGRVLMAMVLQVLSVVMNVSGLALVLAYVAYTVDYADGVALARMYLGVADAVPAAVQQGALDTIPRLSFFGLLAMTLLSLVVLVALLMRWRIALFLFLISGAELAVVGVALTVLLWDAASWGIQMLTIAARGGLVAMNVSLALLILGVALEMHDELFSKKKRLLLRADSDAVGGMALLARGRLYGRRGLWALAAAHLRPAVSWLPNDADAHLSLAVSYLNLKWYDRAAAALADARRIDPDDPKVEELTALLQRATSEASPSADRRPPRNRG